ncbi:type IV toxin-antitoxin system AbiEi family antitoxin [Flavobacterium salmonis]|uniref:Uncharacterized protein n=1 Tax=Flavobacterium salmonis TaxID=2654844 RepID=A0A6V6Z366_9FLAO|nr:type IV toxin-antitoxin system AbiEi family antitoxin [Flavobacterium salmonis]CAD0006115.1 hypothetical protein FLAT13_03134 [Flavobacterium salmonis]
MAIDREIVEEAAAKLKAISGFNVLSSTVNKEPYIIINGTKFRLAYVKEVTKALKDVIIHLIQTEIADKKNPFILITKYIPNDVGQQYSKENRINYLDLNGNCYIRTDTFVILITGQRREKIEKTNQSRAFQEAGIKIIFWLLNNPEQINATYRIIAKKSGVSLASVGYVLQELTALNFFMKTQKGNFLKNKKELLNRWVLAYHDVLRQRLLLKKMRFTKNDKKEWSRLPVQDTQGTVLWGGEPAGSILTRYLSPMVFTLYTDSSWKTLIHDLDLAPSENGEIEVLKIFWIEEENDKNNLTAPPLIVYADLMGSGNDRNIETANKILENELSYIQ